MNITVDITPIRSRLNLLVATVFSIDIHGECILPGFMLVVT